MSTDQICPLRSTTTAIVRCKPECAWNVGSKASPQCAISRISLDLSSIEEQNQH